MNILLCCKSVVSLLLTVIFLPQCRLEPEPAKTNATAPTGTTKLIYPANNIPLKNMFGINSYEWNFFENPAAPSDRNVIYEANMALIKSFSSIRHYMNWNKLENIEGDYTYNPTYNGSWNYDLIYTRCKQEGILVLADMKNLPVWMMNTYPPDQRDDENVPARYGLDRSKPASYIAQARTAFQFAARYGYNTAVNKTLIKVDSRQRWSNDRVNTVKIGMGLIKYIECNNENDRWWKGDKATQSPEEYAANMSAFYDGHKGTLGANAGVKTADPNMIVVMGGLATANANYVQRMINWCKTNRGYKANGKVNLCFDVINYHLYSNNGNILTHKTASTGVAPELSEAGTIADSFIKVANGIPVWVTETGYDINQQSYQHAPPVGDKSALVTQADWILRSSLLYIRHGIKNLFFYQLFDAFPNNPVQYSTSGLAEGTKRRPAADYILQASKLMGTYLYKGTINADPLVDKFQLGTKTMYILTVPDQKGRTANYTLNLGKATAAIIHTLKVGTDVMDNKRVSTTGGKLKITVTETPVFVEAAN
jgi:hypothetical protein